MNTITFAQAIRDALAHALEIDEKVIVYGLGVPDPKGVFGTTIGLQQAFGDRRVFDMPTAENAMTGVGIGVAIGGFRPVLTHQRLDFALLSLDQIINNAAKWRFMFGGKRGVPITIRMIIGRGWGQGPTHSQSLQALFAHIPGIKVVMPANPSDAKGLLISSIFDEDPVIFLEHRWLHNMRGEVPPGDYRVKIGSANILREGRDITIVSASIMTIEALRAVEVFSKFGITCDLIDLRSIRPIDWPVLEQSVKKTGRLLVVDSGHYTGGVAAEVVAQLSSSCWEHFRSAPQRIAMPDCPEATSPALTKSYHIRAEDIIEAVSKLLSVNQQMSQFLPARQHPHDVPGEWFTGPF